MNKFIYLTTLTLALVATCISQAAPNVGEYDKLNEGADFDEDDDSDVSNLLLRYHKLRMTNAIEPLSGRGLDERQYRNRIATIGSQLYDIERESSSPTTFQTKLPTTANSDPQISAQSTSDQEKLKSIAFNNREVKLVGPERKEIELKSDVGTQVLIALENLQKEASDVWGHVNVKLDKGWTDFKTMVEEAVAKRSASAPASSARHLRETSPKDISSLVVTSDVDGYSMADGDDLSKQAESAGSKIKGFLSNIGINEENGKKANEALSKAGASVSETVTKDLPDALKKAGTAVSDTVTKDIPEAFKNFFG